LSSSAGQTAATGGASATVTVNVSVPLSVPSLTVSVSVYVPAAVNVASVAAEVKAENDVAAGFDELHAYVREAAGPSSVAEPASETEGRLAGSSAPR